MTGFFEEAGSNIPVGAHDLDFHTDVVINDPSDGDRLEYNLESQQWTNVPLDTSLVNLGDLGDVDTTGALNGQVLQFDGAEWIPSTQSTVLALDDLVNVTVPTPNDAEVLTWSSSSSAWISSPAGGGGGAANLNDLLDVTLTGPTNDQVLTFTGSVWENVAVPRAIGELTDVTLSSPGAGNYLHYNGSNWENKSFADPLPANPITIGEGVDGTDVALILNGGSLDNDESCIRFQENGTEKYSICQSRPLGVNTVVFTPNENDSGVQIITQDIGGVTHNTSFGSDGWLRIIDGGLAISDSGVGFLALEFDEGEGQAILKTVGGSQLELAGGGQAGANIILRGSEGQDVSISVNGAVGNEVIKLNHLVEVGSEITLDPDTGDISTGGLWSVTSSTGTMSCFGINAGSTILAPTVSPSGGNSTGNCGGAGAQWLNVRSANFLQNGTNISSIYAPISTTVTTDTTQTITGDKNFTGQLDCQDIDMLSGDCALLFTVDDIAPRNGNSTGDVGTAGNQFQNMRAQNFLQGGTNISSIYAPISTTVTTNTTQTITGAKTFNGALNPKGGMSSTSDLYHIFFYDLPGNTLVGSITTNGSSTSYNTTSDYRLKEVISEVSDLAATDLLDKLSTKEFFWKATGELDMGFLAHEVAEVYPNAVTGEKDGKDMQMVDYSKLVPILWAQNKALLNRIEALENS